MKVVILAGGLGTRIGEESVYKPKPMIEIGEHPILWHIMKIYSHYGHNEFIVLGGYKQDMIKKYFQDYFLANSDITFDYKSNDNYEVHINSCENWKVTVLNTGTDTMTGGRIKRAKKYIGNQPFLLTYGDGVSDVDINAVIAQHKKSKALVTLTAFQPDERFGILEFEGDFIVREFKEKPKNHDHWINGGFFVCEPSAIDYIENEDNAIWEQAPLRKIAGEGKLHAYKHKGFWMCMDTLKDKITLEKLWKDGKAPWKFWN